jgi:GAF domain-containing protein
VSILAAVADSLELTASDKPARYAELIPQLEQLVAGEPDLVANLANLAAGLMQGIAVASWVGFYILRGDELVLGPFQGKVACVRIALGRGVCGTAAAERRTVIVPDVEQFSGHIACDAASRSEIVVPVLDRGERLLAVLDVDSTELAAFDQIDAAALAQVAAMAASLPGW